MAEVSESEPLNHSPESGASSQRSTMPGTKRLILILSILFPFLAGLPFLLKSTEIYRSTLPFSSIDSLSARVLPDPPPPACQLHAIFLRPVAGVSAGRMVRLISEEVDKRIKSGHSCGSCGRNYAVSVTIDSGNECIHSGGGEGNSCFWPCGEVDSSIFSKDDVTVDEMLAAALRKGGQCMVSGSVKPYTVLLGEIEAHEGFRNVVGKHRHAWVANGNVTESDAALIIAKIFVKFFMNGGKEDVLQRNGEFVPVGLDGSIVLSFSLLNANPNDWIYDWYG